jgi:hypothetical protein
VGKGSQKWRKPKNVTFSLMEGNVARIRTAESIFDDHPLFADAKCYEYHTVKEDS